MYQYQPRKVSTDKPVTDAHPPATAPAFEPSGIPHLQAPLAVQYAVWREDSKVEPKAWRVALDQIRTISPVRLCLSLVLMASLFSLTALPLITTDGVRSWASHWLNGDQGFMLNWKLLKMAIFLLAFGSGSLLLVSFILASQKLNTRLLTTIEHLKEEGSHPQIPVEISLACDRFEFDRDLGYLTVIDGSLYFYGQRTTFSFSPRVARRPAHASKVSRTLEFYRHGLSYSIRFRSLVTFPAEPPLLGALIDWAGSRVKPGGVEVLPPTSPSVESFRRVIQHSLHKALVVAAICGLPAVATVAVFAAAGDSDHWAKFGGGILALFLGLALYINGQIARGRTSLRNLASEGNELGAKIKP